MAIHRFSFPTQIVFGPGARAELPRHLRSQGLKRPLIVTDRALAGLPLTAAIRASLESDGLAPGVFSEVWGNPVKSQVEAGVRAFHAHGADSIVGLGGGAALDVAKAIALMIHHPGDLFDYEDDKPGALPIDRDIPHFVALPTTSGTGSEVGRSSVISDERTHVKKIIFSPRLLAQAVFADPELTLELPPGITAATGFDALTHCVEAYLAKGFHPICDGIALEGIRLAARHLANAVRAPGDIEARSGMMMSSLMGAIAFQKGLGLTHSCAHALGTVTDMHHGLANAVMIDFALQRNLKAVPERFDAMAQAVGLGDGAGARFVPWLTRLKAEAGIPRDLRAAGVGIDRLEQLVQTACEDTCHLNNPVPVARDDFRRVFTEAFGSGALAAAATEYEAAV